MSSPRALMRRFKILAEAEGCVVEYLQNEVGHFRAHLRHPDGRLQKLTFASTPRVAEETLSHSLQTVRRLARGAL